MPAHAPKIEPAMTATTEAPRGAQMPPWLRHAVRTILHLACDAAAVAASYYLAYRMRFEWDAWVRLFPIPGQVPGWELYRQLLFVVVPLWLVLFWASCRLYSSWMSGPDRFLQILKGCLLGTAATMFATYIYSRLEYSRMMLLMAFPIASVLVWLAHLLVLRIDDSMARCENAKPVLVIGSPGVAQVIKERINARHPEAEVFELRELPQASELEKTLSQRSFYEIILLRSSLSHERILAAAEICDARGVAFKMVPDLLELRLGEVQMDHSLGLPSYRIQHTSMTRLNFAAKRTFDLAFSLLLLCLTAPLWLIAALLIKLDSPGPVLYTQKRYGHKGRVFWAYKFRTMEEGAESKVQAVQSQSGPSGAFFKAKKDPRVTRVGRFLRRFSLDEFPQFINVLRGEMSVVGPRPLALTTGELERLEKDFGATAKKRMNILPGITGLWQVSGRSDVSSEQRFSLDLFYVEHWSLGMDLEIIIKTVPAVLFGKGAY
jgi:exopolysaccharide biosynthesis polyprenyl glycosylphosphotransferase